MDTLPSELLELIVAHCTHTAQKHLRSVNQTLHNLATPLVFSTFHIAPCTFTYSLENLQDLIASKKHLARHITHLTFHTDILPPWSKEKFYEKAAPYSDDPMDLLEAHVAFQSYLKAQGSGWYQDADIHVLRLQDAISSLPNLRSANAGVAVPFQGSTAHWPIWKRLKREILISPDDWLLEDDEDAQYRWDEDRTVATTCAGLSLLEAIGFRSSFAGMKQVEDLKFHALNNGRFIVAMARITRDTSNITVREVASFCPNIETRFQTALAAFTHLTTLDLQIPHPVTQLANQDHAERNALHALVGAETCTILSRAVNLRSLRFAYDSEAGTFWEPSEASKHPLYPLFAPADGKAPWPNLTHLNLSVNLPHTLLLSFLGLLSPTVRRLELYDMCVYDAQALFAGLLDVVKLESIYLECIWTRINVRYANVHSEPTAEILSQGLDVDMPYERDVKAYLLGQAEGFPRLTDRMFLEDGEQPSVEAGLDQDPES